MREVSCSSRFPKKRENVEQREFKINCDCLLFFFWVRESIYRRMRTRCAAPLGRRRGAQTVGATRRVCGVQMALFTVLTRGVPLFARRAQSLSVSSAWAYFGWAFDLFGLIMGFFWS